MATKSTTPRGPYRQELFLNRKTEIQLVRELVGKLRQGASVPKRTLVFTGDRNMGKTWLMLHLAQKVLPALSDDATGHVTESLFYLFNRRMRTEDLIVPSTDSNHGVWVVPPLSSHEETDIIQYILFRTLKRLQAFGHDIQRARIDERTEWLTRHVQEQAEQGAVFVFLLDSISELDDSLLENLEQAMLAPLAELSNVLMVMTGRPPMPRWTSPRLRVHVITQKLVPFDVQQVGEIIQQVDPKQIGQAEQLYEASQGNPGIVDRLAHFMFREGRSFASALDAVIDEQLDVFDDDEGVRKQKEARQAFERLCIFHEREPFRESEMEIMLAEKEAERVSPEEARRIRDLLTSANLMGWDEGGFVLDPSIRHLVATYLRKARPEVWQELHERAAKMYEYYAGQYSQYGKEFEELARQHREAGKSADIPSGRDND